MRMFNATAQKSLKNWIMINMIIFIWFNTKVRGPFETYQNAY